MAANALEKLHKFAEMVLKKILNKEKNKFDKNRRKLFSLTDSTKTFFHKMVMALEDKGL
ncbi:hypothetical protein PIB30_100074, partial [Stylosanthes scabra]|nr:hypothetical protein [Stylosanthes scabra]